MNKLELVVPPQITISRSCDRTINPKNYATGRDYESYKISAFRSRQIPADTPLEEQNKISEDLYQIVSKEVEDTAIAYIKSLQEPDSNELSGKELLQIAPIIQSINDSVEKGKVVEMINDMKLEGNQVKFLRKIYAVKYE